MICTVQLARRFLPLQPRRGLATLAGALNIDVDEVHRALPDARTCARVFCALFGRLCANAPTIGDALQVLGPRKVRTRPATVPKRPRGERPHLAALPHEPGVYVFRDADGKPLYVGKSIDLRTRARAHFTSGAAWTAQAEHVDHQVTHSELGALLLEDRLIKALKPPGNTRGKQEPDGYVYIRCRLDIAFPILEVAREPAAGHAVCVGPVRGRAAAAELVEQLNSLFGLRHCGRQLPRRQHPSAYGQMGRCLSPCLNDLDPNLYRERLEPALKLFVGRNGGQALLAASTSRSPRPARSSATSAPPGCSAARTRIEGLLEPPRPRAAGDPHRRPARPRAAPAGRGALRRDLDRRRPGRRLGRRGRLAARARSARAFRHAPAPGKLGGWLPADAVAEARLVGAWIAANGRRAGAWDRGPGSGARGLPAPRTRRARSAAARVKRARAGASRAPAARVRIDPSGRGARLATPRHRLLEGRRGADPRGTRRAAGRIREGLTDRPRSRLDPPSGERAQPRQPRPQAASAASAVPDSSAFGMNPRAPQCSKCGG